MKILLKSKVFLILKKFFNMHLIMFRVKDYIAGGNFFQIQLCIFLRLKQQDLQQHLLWQFSCTLYFNIFDWTFSSLLLVSLTRNRWQKQKIEQHITAEGVLECVIKFCKAFRQTFLVISFTFAFFITIKFPYLK